jgi:F-type H+-transporting ATPase subunit gamma
MMIRRGGDIMAEFSGLPAAPSFVDVSAIGRLAVEEFLEERADEVYLAYTDFVNMIRQEVTTKKLLPLEIESGTERVHAYEQHAAAGAYLYEPGEEEILNEIVPRFTSLQVYQAILESVASEHAARMVAMKNATDNATEMSDALQLEYNKARQQTITSEMLDIAGGAEALAQSK